MVTGTSADCAGKGGAVVFFNAKTHGLVRRVAMPSSAVGLAWHERLNQIFVGVGAPSLHPESRVVMGAMRFFYTHAIWSTAYQWRQASLSMPSRMLVRRIAILCGATSGPGRCVSLR